MDVSIDRTYQKVFKGFYRVRRNDEWCDKYFGMLEEAKNTTRVYEELLQELKEFTDRIEASFASKLAATIDPTLPIIDKFVLQKFGLRLPYYYEKERIRKIADIYHQLISEYDELLRTDIAKIIIEKFEKMYKWATITDVKKIDLILWQIR